MEGLGFFLGGAILVAVVLAVELLLRPARRSGRGRDRPAFADLAEDEHFGLAEAPERLFPCLLDLAEKVDASPEEIAEAAVRMMDLERADVALGLARHVAAQAPVAGGVVCPVAQVLLRVGEPSRARDVLDRARETRMFTLAEDLLYARVLVADGAPETAVDLLRGACERFPRSFDAHWILGRTLLDLHRPKQALDALLAAATVRPSTPLLFQTGAPPLPQTFAMGAFEADLAEARARVGRDDEEADE